MENHTSKETLQKRSKSISKPIIIDNILYSSIGVASQKLNKSRNTITNWLKKGKAIYINKSSKSD